MTAAPSTSQRYLVGLWTEEDDILRATRAATDAGLPVYDVYTPYAVHGLDEAQKLPRSKVTWIAFFGGLAGFLTASFLQIYTQSVTTPFLSGWPLIIGGKPFLPLPAFVPVWFELTVLFAGLSTAAGMFVVNGLYPGKKARLLIDGVTNDRFAIAFDPSARGFDEAAVRAFLDREHAADVTWVDESPADDSAKRFFVRALGGLGGALAVGAAVWLALNAPHKEAAPEAPPAPPAKPIVLLTEAELQGVDHDEKLVAAGLIKFTSTCVACHGDKGEGKVGPNLTDKFWLHGKGTLADIYATIAKGVPEKGMPAWGAMMTPEDVKALAAYVGSIRGKNLPGKAPQGEAVEGVAGDATPTAAPAPTPTAAP